MMTGCQGCISIGIELKRSDRGQTEVKQVRYGTGTRTVPYDLNRDWLLTVHIRWMNIDGIP